MCKIQGDVLSGFTSFTTAFALQIVHTTHFIYSHCKSQSRIYGILLSQWDILHLRKLSVGCMCREAGILGYYTNHSLRATAATT